MFRFLALIVLFLSSPAQAQNFVQNLQTSVAMDFVAPISSENSENNKLGLREAELTFFGPLDGRFDAVFTAAAHDEHGEYLFEVHEAYLTSGKFIPQSRFKLGTYFLGVGRLNNFHRHDWGFTSAPKVFEEFFGEEGVTDTGLEYSWLLPTGRYWDLTMGVTNGYNYGHSHDEGEKPQVPTHYIHPQTFFSFEGGGALLVGANYVGRTDSLGRQMQVYGLDGTYKMKTGKLVDRLLQGEVWYRILSGGDEDLSEQGGAYVFFEKAFEGDLSLGVRGDVFKDFTYVNEDTFEDQDYLDWALLLNTTWASSEFTKFRAGYTYKVSQREGESDRTESLLELQFVMILGAHPTHDF